MKILKKLTAFAIVAALVFSFGAASLAAPDDNAVNIQLNGKILEYPNGVAPYFDAATSRNYLPFKDLAEALGATVSYDAETRVASAARGDLTVFVPQDGTTITIIKGDGDDAVKSTIEADVKPLTKEGHLLIPVKFVAEAFGLSVGWDQVKKTVLLVDSAAIIAADDSTYEVIGKLLTMANPTSGNQKLTMDMKLDIKDSTLGEIPITVTLTAVASDTACSGTASLKVNLTALDMGVGDYTANAEFIANLNTGAFYFLSNELNTLLGLAKDTWLTATADDFAYYAGVSPDDLTAAAAAAQITDGESLMAFMTTLIVDSYPLTSVEDYDLIYSAIEQIRLVYADKNFKAEAGKYVNTIDILDNSPLVFTIVTDSKGNATEIRMDFSIADEGMKAEMHLKATATVFDMSFSMADSSSEASIASINFTLKTSASATTSAPRTAIPAGAKTASIFDFLNTGGLI